MIERMFAKYARAVSDEDERRKLYRLYCAKVVLAAIFYVLCIALIITALSIPESEQFTVYDGILLGILAAWLISAVLALAVTLTFRSRYRAILNRPASPEEMPEVASYRSKVSDDKKSAFKSLWWAWAIFAACAIFMIAAIAVETAQNPDSQEFGPWGIAGTAVFAVGMLVLFFALIIYNTKKTQEGATVEMRTAAEAQAIDEAQGREHKYSLEADRNANNLRYLFPDEQLYAQVDALKRKYNKITLWSVIISCVIAVVVDIVIFSDMVFEFNLEGYAMPVLMTIILLAVYLSVLPTALKIEKLEKAQKAQLESNPAYAKNLEIYKKYEEFSRFKGKIYIIILAATVVIGYVLAVLFPDELWSYLTIIPLLAGLFVHTKLYTGLRKQVKPLEDEIDRIAAERAAAGQTFAEGAAPADGAAAEQTGTTALNPDDEK